MNASEGPRPHDHASEPENRSSSLDNLLLLLAALVFAGSCLVLVGIIPVLIMGFGAYQALASGDVKNATVSVRFLQIVAIAGALFCAAQAMEKQIDVEDKSEKYISSQEALSRIPDVNMDPVELDEKYGQGAAISIIMKSSSIRNQYYYSLLAKEEAEYQRNQFLILTAVIGSAVLVVEFLWLQPFARQLPVWRAARLRKQSAAPPKGSPIIKRDGLAPYSVADELIKWNRLREEGLVTDAQFEDARAKLLDGA